ncbi:MAG: acetate--CoA ligase family protein [Pseudomonadota bacterium]
MNRAIEKLLNPSAVAILGATEGEHRIGGRVLHYMRRSGFPGAIYPVNPKREVIQGLKAYPSILDVPGDVDCAVLSVPAAAVNASLEACGEKGVEAAVLFSAGFAELGDEGKAMQAELTETAQRAGIRFLGPNCLGAFNAHSGFIGTFSSNIIDRTPEPGKVGIVSQSGAFGAHLYSLCDGHGIGISYWVTTGNEADITIADCIAFMATSDEVTTILVYAEGMNDVAGLAEALELARANRKPVIFLKVGRSEAGAKAAQSHTASLAVSDVIVDAFLKQHGAHRAETTDEMVELAYACQTGRFPEGRRVGILTISGGAGVQMADICEPAGLQVPEFPASAQKKITDLLPFASATNPVDMTATVVEKPELLLESFDLASEVDDCDAFASFLTPIAAREEVIEGLSAWAAGERKQRLLGLCAPVSVEIRKRYEDAGILFFDTPDKVIRGIAGLAGFAEKFRSSPGTGADAGERGELLKAGQTLNEMEAKSVLSSWGVPVVRESLVTSADEAVAAAGTLGGPAVLKIASPDIAHKTEIGGVLLNVDGADAVASGFAELTRRAAAASPDARVDGVIVSEMVSQGVETVIGVQNDPTFGPAVMFGLGGVLVEVLKDVSFRLAPFDVDEAMTMIAEIKGFAVLEGVRGQPPVDIQALAETLSAVSRFAAAHADLVDGVDINPFLVSQDRAVALDALIVPKAPPS